MGASVCLSANPACAHQCLTRCGSFHSRRTFSGTRASPDFKMESGLVVDHHMRAGGIALRDLAEGFDLGGTAASLMNDSLLFIIILKVLLDDGF